MAVKSLHDLLEFSEAKTKKLSYCKTSPRHFEDWISHLAAAGPMDVAKTLHNSITELSQLEISTPKLFQCLEFATPRLVDLHQQLSPIYLVRSLGLNQDQVAVAEAAHKLNHLIIKCYNRVVIEGLKSDDEYALAIGRSMEWLLQMVYRCFALYLPLPQNTWRQLNALYAFSECRDFLDKTFKQATTLKKANVSIQNIFIQNALLVCAQPLQLQQTQISHLLEMLPELAQLAKITSSLRGGKSVFQVDLADEKPPSYIKDDQLNLSMQLRFLNLEKVLEALQSAEKTGSFLSQLGSDIATHLRRNWKDVPRRTSERIQSNNAVEFALGLNQAFLALTDGMTPARFIEKYHTELFDDPMNPAAITPNQSEMEIGCSKGIMVNHSEGGFCLKLDAIPDHLESGELLTLMHPHLQKLVFTIIKWIQLVNRKSCRLGVQLLTTDATACVVQIINEKGEASGIRPALLISMGSGKLGNPLLVCAKVGTRFCQAIRIYCENQIILCIPKRKELITGNLIISEFSEISEDELSG